MAPLRTSGEEEEKGHENRLIDREALAHGGRQRLGAPTGRRRFRSMEERRQGGLRHTNPKLKNSEKNPGKNNLGAIGPEEANFLKNGLGSLVHKPAQGILGLASRMFQSKRARNGGLIGGGIVGIAILIITTFTPVLRLDHLFQNINNRAFAAAGSAVEHRMEYLTERYMLRKIIGLRGCKAVVSTNCRVNYANAGLATNMFNAWRDARVEEKLFAKMGLSVESTRNPDRAAGVHSFTLRDKNGRTIKFNNEGDWNRFVAGHYEGGRREFGREMRKALKDTTHGLNIMQRKQVRKMLVRKHGIKFWCFLACKKKDAAEEKIKDSRTKWKYRFVERFVYPFSTKYGVILTCITAGDVSSGNCSKKLKQQDIDRSSIPESDIDEILGDLENAENRGQLRIGSVVLERILVGIIGNKTVARATLSAIPVVGQVYLGLTMLYLVDTADQAIENNELSKMAANINSTQYIEFYTGIRSDSDALKQGALPLDDLGAHVAEFDGAEKSKVYQAYTNNPANNKFAFSLSPASVSAAGNDEEYKCVNGKPISAGEYVCEEKKVARQYNAEEVRDNFFVGGIIDLLNPMDNCLHFSPDIGPISTPCAVQVRDAVGELLGAVDFAIQTVFGPIAKGALFVLENAPGSKQLIELMKEKFETLALAMFEKIWPLPVNESSPGREKYDALEAGGDLAANDFTKGGYTDDGDTYGQGAPKIKKEDLAAIYQDNLEQEEYEFKNSSFVNRIASIDEPNSLISKLAFNMPANFSAAFLSVLSAPANFFNVLANMPGLVFSSPVNAQSLSQRQADINAFGVSRYGYPLGHPALKVSPSKYTPEYCQKLQEARKESMSENKTTGFEEYSTADPCLLERIVVDSGCTLFVEGNGCLEEEGGGGGAAVSGDAQSLAKEIIDSGKISGDPRYMGQLEAIANGNFECNVNPYILEMLVGLAREGHSLYISSLNRQCTGVIIGAGTTSYHYREGGGHAIDITSFDGQPTTGGANTVAYWEAAIPLLPEGTGIGQVASCESGFSLPSGFSPVPDSCNHAHIQVPVKQAGE